MARQTLWMRERGEGKGTERKMSVEFLKGCFFCCSRLVTDLWHHQQSSLFALYVMLFCKLYCTSYIRI